MRRTVALTAILFLAGASQAVASGAISGDGAQIDPGSYAASVPAASDYARARTALLAGDYDRAVFLLEPLADGAGVPAQLLAGYANLGAGRIDRAEFYFNRAVGRDRSNAFGLHGLGLVALAKGDRVGATTQLELLQSAERRCKRTCSQSAEIGRALASLTRAIG